MKVIMIRSNPINPDTRLEKEAKTLADAGYKVSLLGWLRFGEAPLLEKKSHYDIKRIKLRAPLGKVIILYLPIWWSLVFFHLLREEWDVVHATDLDTFVPALFAAKLRKKKIVYDIFDFYVDMVTVPIPIRNVIAKFDFFLMRYADALIIVDPSRLKQIHRDNDSSVVIIFNSPLDNNHITDIKFQKNESCFKIFYAGMLYEDRGTASVIEVVKNNNTIKLEIAGWGQYEKELIRLMDKESNITFNGILPYDEVIQRTLQSDLLFALYDPSIPNNRYASPNKLFEAMMCEKPILVSDGTAMADIVRKENCGIIVPYGNVGAIRQTIGMLKDDPQLCRQLGANGRKAYEQKYNWKIMGRRLVKVYENL
jgi:glycosyltransferase involved in cell wall biosynthesis